MEEQQSTVPKEFPRGPLPAVFMFQPTRYEVVTGERLKEWETLLRENVGLRGELRAVGLPSICFCPGADDCDQI